MEHAVFGCKVNKYYLNKWLQYFSRRGYTPDDTLLMATCVVTDKAKTTWIKSATKELVSGKALFLTWCGAFEKGEAMDYEQFYRLYPELFEFREQITLLWEDPSTQTDLGDIGMYDLNKEIDSSKSQTLSNNFLHRLHTKKFVVIQSWCDTFCTFCLTIYKRWSQRSRPLQDIIDEINAFVELWGKEIVLTWVNLASRWASNTRKPEESRFSQLLEAILERTTIPRIRISSLWPEFLDEHFFTLLENPRFLPHFHLSIQHVVDEILLRMHRNYTRKTLDQMIHNFRELKRPDRDYLSIGADIIVGFPGETDAQFRELLEVISAYGLTKLHAFPFSPHHKGESVPAGSFPDQIPQAIKKQRMREILALGESLQADFLARNRGLQRPVLLEKKVDAMRQWRTPNYIEAHVLDNGYTRGDIVERKIP